MSDADHLISVKQGQISIFADCRSEPSTENQGQSKFIISIGVHPSVFLDELFIVAIQLCIFNGLRRLLTLFLLMVIILLFLSVFGVEKFQSKAHLLILLCESINIIYCSNIEEKITD